MPWYFLLLLTLAVMVLPFVVGNYLAARLRMPDYGWKLSLIFWTLAAGTVITIFGWPPSLGVDLSGGVVLVYQVGENIEEADAAPAQQQKEEAQKKALADEAAEEDATAHKLTPDQMQNLIAAISRRVNPAGVKEVTIRPYGSDHVEIIIPKADANELERIKRIISSAGTLEFRILANSRDNKATIEQALSKPDRYVRDAEGNIKAMWVPVEKGQEEHLLRIGDIANRMEKIGGRDVLQILVLRDKFNVTGGFLTKAVPGADENGRPCVDFFFDSRGGQLFGGLTSNNLPDTTQDFKRCLGIILNGYLYSAPQILTTIHEQGKITGEFTNQEVNDLVAVLNAGSLPSALSERPVSEMVTGPTLGRDTIERGRQAMVVATVLVLAFMLIYYRFSGMVACMALLMNLLLLVAIMILIRADFTMPGLAGLVLTIGTAVDANVLIYERMREELARGATIRMAIRDGFSRASTAIVDSNLTNLIAATVLWIIGTDQIKGFAVVLWLGVILSLYTAIFCARVVFDIAERQHWITELRMMKLLTATNIDFLKWRRPACVLSIVIIVLGLVAVVVRGPGILDIDFTGGTSVEILFKKPVGVAEVRSRLEKLPDLTVSDVQIEREPRGLRFVINTSDRNIDGVQDQVQRAFGDQLARNTFTVSDLKPVESASSFSEPSVPQSSPPAAKPEKEQSRSDLPPDTLLAAADKPEILLAQAQTPNPADPNAGGTPDKQPGTTPDTPAADQSAAPAQKETPQQNIEITSVQFIGGAQARLKFAEPVDYATIEAMFSKEFETAGGVTGPVEYEISSEKATPGDTTPQPVWDVKIKLPPEKAGKFFEAVEKQLASQPHFPSASNIGGRVATDTQMKAVVAIIASLLGIVIYVWVRFQHLVFGVASVAALIHDVLVTLGAVAVSIYVAPFLGFLMVDPFKISLTVLAAFLTIIGYSINDTIVIFDRIREIRGKSPRLTADMINAAINQTLSRTILTFFLAFMVLVVLYVAAGQSVHAFAYAMVVGFIAGTYSTVYVASAIVYWLTGAVESEASS